MKAIKNATTTINASSPPISQAMYMEALKDGIEMAEERRKNNPKYVCNCFH